MDASDLRCAPLPYQIVDHFFASVDLKQIDSLLLPLPYLARHQVVHFVCLLVVPAFQLVQRLKHLFLLD